MKRLAACLLAGAMVLGASLAYAADDSSTSEKKTEKKSEKKEKAPKKRGTFEANRAGWLLGMYVGSSGNSPFPVVFQVDRDSQAYAVGVREGDEIVRFNSYEVTPIQRLFDEANRINAGRYVTMFVRRGAENRRFDLRMTKNPGADPTAAQDEKKQEASTKKSKDKKKKDEDKTANGDDKAKKPEKKSPVVIKPIPSGDPQ